MISFGVIWFLVLVLIYFVLRNQSMQRRLRRLRRAAKATDSQNKFSLRALVILSGQLQRTYQTRLETLQKHALINSHDYELASFIVAQVELVIMQCCEHRTTVEEAINKALDRSNYNIEQINQFIARQPAEIKLLWCKNSIDGFISACHNMTSERLKLKAKNSDLPQETNQSKTVS